MNNAKAVLFFFIFWGGLEKGLVFLGVSLFRG